MAGILGIPPKYAHDLISCAMMRKPRFPGSAQGTEKKKCSGVNGERKSKAVASIGYLAEDGRLYHCKNKASSVTRAVKKREEVIRTLQHRETARLDRLKKAAKSGDIAFTKDGVFETKPCPSCDVYHKVPYVCSPDEPCPNSYLAKHPLRDPVKLPKFSTEDLEKKLPPVVHVGAQTSNTTCKVKSPGRHVSVQTAHKQLPDVATQTSKGFLPELGPPVCRPSCIKPQAPSSKPPPPEKRRKLRFKLVPQVQEVYLSECSSCDSSSCDSIASDQLELEKEKEKERDKLYLAHLENIEKEENALSENLEKQKKRYHLNKEKVRRLTIDKARQEIQDKKELDAVKHEFAEELKRKLALQAMLNTMNREQGKMELAIEKEKAARRVEEEKRKLDELLAEQLRLHMESKKSQFIKEKVDRDMESFQPPSQTEGVKSAPSSQLPHLSSFNIGKMAQTAKENYSRKEAAASPAIMMEILDSFPDETASQSGSLTDEESTSSLAAARNELKIDMKKTLVILDGITRNVATMMGYSLPPMKPAKATPSKVEKLPPITNQYMTTTPINWSKEKLSDESAPKKLVTDEVKLDESTPKKLVTDEVKLGESTPKKLVTDERKAYTPGLATEKCSTCGKAEAVSAVAAEKMERKAKIQAKITELEKAMKEEMQKLQQIDEEPATEPADVDEEFEERRIAQVEEAMKEKEESRIAELERAKQVEKEAELAKEKEAKMAEYDRIIKADTDYKIAMVEKAKRKMYADRYAEIERFMKAEEQASKKDAELERAKQTENEAELAKEKQAKMAEYDRIIQADTKYKIAMVEKAKRKMYADRYAEIERFMKNEEEASKKAAELDRAKQAEKDAQLAKEKQAKREIEEARLAEIERAKKEEEEACKKAAELERAKKVEEEARKKAAELEIAKKLAEDASKKAAELEEAEEEARKKAAELEQAKKEAEEEARMKAAELEQAKKEAEEEARKKAAELEQAKKEAEEEARKKAAELEQAKRLAEEASKKAAELEQAKKALEEEVGIVSAELDKTEESVVEQSGEVENNQVTEEVEEEIPEQCDSEEEDEIELQKSYVQPIRSHPRPPTPPAGHPRMYHSHASLFGAQASLRTINESSACDFTPEFASPLITHSMHAVVPYRSLRTQLGLRPHEAMTDKELGEEMRKFSEATLVLKKEMMKRKRSRELSNENVADPAIGCLAYDEGMDDATASEATEPFMANEAQEVIYEEAETPIEENMQKSGNEHVFEEEAVAELEAYESEIFSEPPEPYFTMTAEEMMPGDNPEPVSAKSTSTESLKSGASNELVAVQAHSVEREETLMADMSQRLFDSEPSEQSLEDEYVNTLNQLATAYGIAPEEVVKHMTPTPELLPAEDDNEPPMENHSNASIEVEASDTSMKSAEEASRLKRDSWTQTSNTSLMSTGTLRSYSTSSLNSIESYTASLKNEAYGSEVESHQEQAELEFDDVASTATPKKSSSKSSVRSKASQTSFTSASASVVSVKNETSPEKPERSVPVTPKSSSKSSLKSKASKTSLKSDAGSIVSVKNEMSPEVESQIDQPPIANVDDMIASTTAPKKSSSKSSVKSKSSKTSLKSASGSVASIKNETTPELETQPAQAESGVNHKNASTETPKKSSSKSSMKSKSSKTSLKSVSDSTVSVKNENTTEPENCETIPQAASKDALTATPKSSSKSSVKSKTSLKSISGSTVSIKNETTPEPEQSEMVPPVATKDASTATPKSSSKSSVRSKSSKTSLKSASGAQVSVKNEASPPEVVSSSEQNEIHPQVGSNSTSTEKLKKSSSKSSVKSKASKTSLESVASIAVSDKIEISPVELESQPKQLAANSQVPTIHIETATPKSSSKSSIKSKTSKTSLKSTTDSIVSVKNETSPESEQCKDESQIASSKDASTATPKSSSKSSVRSKSSKTSLKSVSGSTVSVKNETTAEPKQCEIVPQVASKDASTATPKKSSSKSSVRSKSSKTSLKSASGSTISVKNETTAEPITESQPGQAELEAKVKDDITQPLKSSSKSSVRSKSSKTSLKSASGAQDSVKNESSPEAEPQTEQREIDSQEASKDASTATPKKSSSKSFIKSKSSKISLKSVSGSTVSVKNETTTEPEQSETVPPAATKDASTATPKSSSKSSVRSKSSKTSLKSVSGAQDSVKNESSPEAEPQTEQCKIDSQVASKDASTATPKKSSSKSSVKSKSSKTSLKSVSGAQVSIKTEMSPESEQNEIVPQIASKDASTATPKKSSSKSSVKSKSSKTSLKSASGSVVSVKNETDSSPEAGSQSGQLEPNLESASISGQSASSGTRKSSSKTSIRSKAGNTSTSGSRVSVKNEAYPEVGSQQEQCINESEAVNKVTKSSSKSSVKSKSSKTSLKSISESRVSIKNETTTEAVSQSAQQENGPHVRSAGSRVSVKNETPLEAKSQPDQVIESQVASAGSYDASTGTPKSSSKSSLKSKTSKTSLLSISGSKISYKNETYAEVVSKPEQTETEPKVAKSSSNLKTSTPSLRVFMKAVSDISPKGSQIITPIIGKSISRQSATLPKTSATKLESSRSPSTASIKLIKSPTGSTRSLKSLRSSMKSLILPSMGSKKAVNTEKDDETSKKVEPNKSYASVVSSGSQSNITAGQ